MPRGFSDDEKNAIREQLLVKGRELFGVYGLKKTSVEEITDAVGISKGAFYLFYASKEELFFDMLEQVETETQNAILRGIENNSAPPAQRFRDVSRQALTSWKTSAAFLRFGRDDYEHLLRKLPSDRVLAAQDKDDRFAAEFVAAWERQGVRLRESPEMIAGLLRSVFFVTLHEHEINPAVYGQVFDLLIDLLARHLLGENAA